MDSWRPGLQKCYPKQCNEKCVETYMTKKKVYKICCNVVCVECPCCGQDYDERYEECPMCGTPSMYMHDRHNNPRGNPHGNPNGNPRGFGRFDGFRRRRPFGSFGFFPFLPFFPFFPFFGFRRFRRF